jgi:F-type H+-transporting ATPase subunit b
VPSFGLHPPRFPLAAEAGHEENGVHLAADVLEVVWGSIAFAIVAAFLVWKVGPQVVATMRRRTEHIAATLAAAASERAEAEAELLAATAERADPEVERARVLAGAEAEAEAVAAAILARAQAEAQAIRARARSDADSQRRLAEKDLTSEISGLAGASAEAAVRRSVDPAARRALIDDYIEEVARLS